MKQHDYAQALENFNRGSFDYEDRDTIRHALRFAEKMMQEPSEGMLAEAEEKDILYHKVASADEIFTAMRDQALKELGE